MALWAEHESPRQRGPVYALRDSDIRERFDKDLLAFLSETIYNVVTIVIDKLELVRRYATWRFDPYHYCLTVLMERYVLYLSWGDLHGDVLAESRGGHVDRRLKDSFARLFEQGTEYVRASLFAERLTSRQLRVKQKSNNIAGLQIADLLAHPSHKAALSKFSGEPLPGGFAGKIIAVLEQSKYYRKEDGTVKGWGLKLLP